MKLIISIMAILFISSHVLAQSSNNILGIWISEKRDGKIEIYQQGDKLFGKIVWTKIAGAKDDKNPDTKLRNKPLLGLVILTNFKNDGANQWSDGKIYDPESGKTFSCNMKLKEGKLEIRGYVGISMFGRTSVWTRN
jgi:uncharacterized protein (DUF2147 family)